MYKLTSIQLSPMGVTGAPVAGGVAVAAPIAGVLATHVAGVTSVAGVTVATPNPNPPGSPPHSLFSLVDSHLCPSPSCSTL